MSEAPPQLVSLGDSLPSGRRVELTVVDTQGQDQPAPDSHLAIAAALRRLADKCEAIAAALGESA